MKAIILAAGVGKRLMPLTKDTHKSLLKLRHQPIIREQITELNKCGIKKIAVVVGYKKEQIMGELSNSVDYFFNPKYDKTNSVVSLWAAREFMKDEDILVFNGDLLVNPSIIQELIAKDSDFCTVVDVGKWNPNGYKAKIENGKVIDMSMNFKKDEVGGEYAGMTKISKNKLDTTKKMLDKYVKEKKVNDWYETAFVSMIKEGNEMDFVDTKNRWWIEIDYIEELEEARHHFKMQTEKNEA